MITENDVGITILIIEIGLALCGIFFSPRDSSSTKLVPAPMPHKPKNEELLTLSAEDREFLLSNLKIYEEAAITFATKLQIHPSLKWRRINDHIEDIQEATREAINAKHIP